MTVSTILAAKGRDVVTIEPSASLAAAAELLAKKRIGAIVILGADRRIVGILSNGTLCVQLLNAARIRSANL
jgi:CBS domain-containing protein